MSFVPKGLASVLKNTSGSVAVMFSVSAAALLVTAGVALDYVRSVNMQTALQSAADSAALAAARAAIQAELDGKNNIKKIAESAGTAAWELNVQSVHGIDLKPKFNLQNANGSWTANVSFDGSVPTTFASLMGLNSIKIGGDTEATVNVGRPTEYFDFYFAIDISSSMGIGATQGDMNKMDAAIGCTFACHFGAGGGTIPAAHAAGAKLRVDVVDEAVDNVVSEMLAADPQNVFRASLVGIADDAAPLVPLTDNLASISNHDIQIVMSDDAHRLGNTNYRQSLETLNGMVGTAGDGSQQANAKKVVFFVTDGVHDYHEPEPNATFDMWNNSDHFGGAIDPAFCQTLKDAGAIVSVLYIDYIVPNGFEPHLDPFINDTKPALEACATPGNFFNAKSPGDIKVAMKNMFTKSLKQLTSVRLSR
jgi:Flp pilus assembly protein TadG